MVAGIATTRMKWRCAAMPCREVHFIGLAGLPMPGAPNHAACGVQTKHAIGAGNRPPPHRRAPAQAIGNTAAPQLIAVHKPARKVIHLPACLAPLRFDAPMKQQIVRRPRYARGAQSGCSALLLAILGAFANQAGAQAAAAAPAPAGTTTVESGASLSYVGARSRVGIGYDRDTKARGEFSHVLTEDALSAFIAQGWISKRSGGVRADYNWIGGADGKPAPGSLVRKLFGAFDRNQDGDRKATIGFGLESEMWFGNLAYSRGLSGKRYIDALGTTTETTQQSGTDAGRPFIDTITTTTTTRLFERAYEHGIGVRAGRFYSPALLRLSLGFDREWGDFSARQNTVSLDLEKFFSGSPHSLALHLERYNKSGEYETRSNDTRVQVMYRYSFGGSNFADSAGWRQTRTTQQMPVETPGTPARAVAAPVALPPATLTRSESRIVKTTATMTSDAFFALDRATLTDTARRELDRIAELLKGNGHSGNVRIVGHTCDLGSDAYNMKLSMRRANAVRDYLVSRGAGSAETFVAEGMGERDPKYPNTRAMRPKNRRVDLEFIQYQDKTETVPVPVPAPAMTEATPATVRNVPVVEWKSEVIDSEPAWVRRALHNTVRHKQTVDTYRGADVERTSSSVRAFGNRPPVAQDDALTVAMDAAATIAVLANDSDPDGNTLAVVSVTTPAHGTASIAGNAIVYTPAAGYSGSDSFSYTIDDGAGGRASARVAVTVQGGAGGNRPPVAANDRYLVRYEGDNPLPVLSNDSDPDGDTLSIVSFTQPALGVVRQSGNQLVYTGAGKFTLQTITYTISDGRGGTATATVELVDP